jgi:hypothetical protein
MQQHGPLHYTADESPYYLEGDIPWTYGGDIERNVIIVHALDNSGSYTVSATPILNRVDPPIEGETVSRSFTLERTTF